MSEALSIRESLGSKARAILKDFILYNKSMDHRIVKGASFDLKDYTEVKATKLADLRPYSNMVTVVIDGDYILVRGINQKSWSRSFPVHDRYGTEYRITSIDLNPGCTVFVCPDQGDENTATGNAQIFMADPKRATKWWKYFVHTIYPKLEKIFQDTGEEWTIFRWFDKTDAKKVLSRGEYNEVYTLVKMLNSFHTKAKDQASTSNALYTMKVWFTDTNHERFYFPRLYTSLKKLKGHVQEDFREVLVTFVDRIETIYDYQPR
jgi:hypothetical protein